MEESEGLVSVDRAERFGRLFHFWYLAASVLWILGTDALIDRFAPLPTWVGSLKDIVYLVACSFVIQRIVRIYLSGVRRAHSAQTAAKLELVGRLAMAAEYRDDQTGGHNHRIARSAQILGEELGLAPEACGRLYYAAALHDLGKIAVPDGILHKPGPLNAGEREIMETHAQLGADLLAHSQHKLLQTSHGVALCHHEKWDGSGYPQGLLGEEIPLEARIVAVCDVFDALTSERPYKDAWSVKDAAAEIRRGSGTHFDPKVVEAFFDNLLTIASVRDEKPRPWDEFREAA